MEDLTLEITESGRLSYNGIAVGEVSDGVLRLELGWCRLASLAVVVSGDPKRDSRRVVLNRGNESTVDD